MNSQKNKLNYRVDYITINLSARLFGEHSAKVFVFFRCLSLCNVNKSLFQIVKSSRAVLLDEVTHLYFI